MEEEMRRRYERLLEEYLERDDEDVLYQAEMFSKEMTEQGISPEVIIDCHTQFLKNNYPELPQVVEHSLKLLLEVMVWYGLAYRKLKNLIEKQMQLQSELEIAASMQHTFLPEVPYHAPGIDLGIQSKAANQMSGDYYYFRHHENLRQVGVGIADIIGKGIPAALCMSMIKYGIDSLPDERHSPNTLLENLNRTVEKNIDPSMFITMIYGVYDLQRHHFQYATAGHEPALFYSAQECRYQELKSGGLVLGLTPQAQYTTFEVNVLPGDMLILFSDGITESVRDGRFITHDEFISLIDKYKHLSAQTMTEYIHEDLLEWSNYNLKDDQTIIIIKRK